MTRHAGTRARSPARLPGSGSVVHDHLARAVAGRDAAWMARAACGGRGDDLFFPPGYTADAAVELVELAKLLCLRCPVLRACRTWALEVPETDGIWGATTPAERRTLRRTHRKEAAS